MGETSKIEWTNSSWTPIRARNKATGKIGWHCEHATTGCEFCYAEGMNRRLGTGLDFKPGHRKDLDIFLDEEMLLAPLRWKKPRRIFVCSMTDLFADFVKDQWIDLIFAVAAKCQHTLQILTKRPDRMFEYLTHPDVVYRVAAAMTGLGYQNNGAALRNHWPLRNVWLGVSAERQQEADERIPHLLQTPAAVRFVSLEPLLGPLVMKHGWLGWKCAVCSERAGSINACGDCDPCIGALGRKFIDLAIVGGESGPHARDFNLAWPESLLRQCRETCTAFFLKQIGDRPVFTQYDESCTSQDTGRTVRLTTKARAGKDMAEWPEALRVREFPR